MSICAGQPFHPGRVRAGLRDGSVADIGRAGEPESSPNSKSEHLTADQHPSTRALRVGDPPFRPALAVSRTVTPAPCCRACRVPGGQASNSPRSASFAVTSSRQSAASAGQPGPVPGYRRRHHRRRRRRLPFPQDLSAYTPGSGTKTAGRLMLAGSAWVLVPATCAVLVRSASSRAPRRFGPPKAVQSRAGAELLM